MSGITKIALKTCNNEKNRYSRAKKTSISNVNIFMRKLATKITIRSIEFLFITVYYIKV